MEELKKSEAMIMEEWRNNLQKSNGNGDVFEIIKRAIMVAAYDHPKEFLIKRDEIAQTLFSSSHHQENIACQKKMKEEDDVNNHGGDTKQDLVHDDDVLRIKQILEHAKKHHEYSNESESIVYESLSKLQEMGGMSFKTLEATMIGKSVRGFQKHPSMEIRLIARGLINKWKCVVAEWIEASEKTSSSCVVQQEQELENKESKAAQKQISNAVELRITKSLPISEEKAKVEEEKKESKVAEKQMVMKKESSNNVVKLRIMNSEEKAKKVVEDDHNLSGSKQRSHSHIITSVEEKLEASKRKLHQRYEEVQSAKRQRKIQVIEPYQLIKKQKQDLILNKFKYQNRRRIFKI